MVPIRTGFGLSLAAIERSAESNTPVVSDAVLFARFRSAVDADTLAWSTSAPATPGVVIRMAIDGAAPTMSNGRVQVTIWPASAHVQPIPSALRNCTLPSGRRLVTTRLVASRGPRLATAIV